MQVTFPTGVIIASLAPVGPQATEMAIDASGNAWGWGDDRAGQLCMGNTDEYNTPVELPLTDVTLAAGAGDHAAYDAGGILYSCGGNKWGDLGTGSPASATTPQQVVGLPASPVLALTASWRNTGATMADGTYWNWGYNAAGQLGNHSKVSSDVPVEVHLPTTVKQVAEGGGGPTDGQTIAILTDGSIWGWGNDKWGQLCGAIAPRPSVKHPVEITPPAGVTWTFTAGGGATDYWLDSSGGVWGCGDNSRGQLGTGMQSTGANPTPRKIVSGISIISSTNFNEAAE